jgi:hypothetical protein
VTLALIRMRQRKTPINRDGKQKSETYEYSTTSFNRYGPCLVLSLHHSLLVSILIRFVVTYFGAEVLLDISYQLYKQRSVRWVTSFSATHPWICFVFACVPCDLSSSATCANECATKIFEQKISHVEQYFNDKDLAIKDADYNERTNVCLSAEK